MPRYAAEEIKDATPDPEAWPACQTCGLDYELRRTYPFGSSPRWAWFRACRRHISLPMLRRRSDGQ